VVLCLLRSRATGGRKGKVGIVSNPLEEGLVVDVNLVRKKISAKLKAEKRAFMQRLDVSRNIRSRVEMNAAIRIQALYRGHAARCKLDENIAMCTVSKAVRLKLLYFLNQTEEKINPKIKDWSAFRQAYSARRNLSALKIQCCFRRFVSRRTLSCKRHDMFEYRAHMSIIRIQAMSRRALARIWAKKVAADARFNVRKKAARRIQNMIRIFLSCRRVQRRRWKMKWVAARMIQCWFRGIRSRRLCFVIRKRTLQWKQFFATRKFQCMIRKFLSRKRLNRMKDRATYLTRFLSTSCIQRRIRGILARIRVRKFRDTVTTNRRLAAEKRALMSADARKRKKDTENADLLRSVDIFHQANLNHVTEVDDILHGRVTEEQQDPNQTNSENGDTILSVAARIGNVEFCRKCLLWGCDINRRNMAGDSPLMIAVKHQQVAVVQYLLLQSEQEQEESGDVAGTKSGKANKTLAPLSRDDAGTMLVSAAMGNTEQSRDILRILLYSKTALSPSCQSPLLGQTALHGAAEVGDIEAITILLKARASIDAVDDMGQTPLHKAIYCPGANACDVFNFLLQLNSSFNMSLDPSLAYDDEVNNQGSSVTEGGGDGANGLTLEVPGSPVNPANNASSTPTGTGAPDSASTPAAPVGALLKQMSSAASALTGTPNGNADSANAATGGTPRADGAGDAQDGEGAAGGTQSPLMSAKADWRVGKILRADSDGKDCLLLAMIHGQADILQACQTILEQADMLSSYQSPEEIGWTPNDIASGMQLAQSGNLVCLEQLLTAGFDPTWAVEETGQTLAMTACLYGQCDVLDMLMSKGIDLTVTDTTSQRRNALHYAAACVSNTEMLSYVLTHEHAKACKVTDSLLFVADADGRTVLHIAAMAGLHLSLPATVDNSLSHRLLSLKDNAGLTPLQLAASYLQLPVVTKLIQTYGISYSDIGLSLVHHVFHPNTLAYTDPQRQARPIMCSEYLSRTKPADTFTYNNRTVTRREDACRLAEDIDALTLILRVSRGKGEHMLYTDKLLESSAQVEDYLCKQRDANVDSIFAAIEDPKADGSSDEKVQAGDILIREKSIMTLRVLPDVCSTADCWRLRKFDFIMILEFVVDGTYLL
jgi:ankyrin repeat protein